MVDEIAPESSPLTIPPEIERALVSLRADPDVTAALDDLLLAARALFAAVTASPEMMPVISQLVSALAARGADH